MNAVEFKNVSFGYGANTLLNGLSLNLAAGQFHVLLGPNGAGKSTIFNLITGLLSPKTGDVQIFGEAITPKSLALIGAVFQQSSLDQELSVAQNLSYFAALHGRKISSQEITNCLERFELAEHRDRFLGHLSGGQKRRVEIARVLLHQPKLLIMDEPTVGLDLASKDTITKMAHDLIAEGMTVLWVTHLLDEIYDQDHVLILREGALAEEGDLTSLGGIDGIKSRYAVERRAAL